jgi:Flp pilus assembly protein TadD
VALNNYGSALLALRQYAQAQQPFARLIQLQPNNAVAMAKLAWCLAAQDKRQDATVVLDRARQVAPNHPVVQQVQRILERR